MRRRTLCTALATIGSPITRSACAAPASKTWRIGFLELTSSDAESEPALREFRAELVRKGYVDSSKLIIVRRRASPNDTGMAASLAAELVRMNVDVIYAFPGTASALAAKKATPSIPIVFHSSADPVGFGLVASLAKPGGNVTGLAQLTFDQASKSLQFLAEASKKLSSFAFISSLRAHFAPWFQGTIAASNEAAARLGIRVQTIDVASFQNLEPVVQDLTRRGVNGVALLSNGDDLTPEREADIASLLIRYKLPSLGTPRLGFLLEMGTPYGYEARTVATLVDKILRGAKPADLPVEQPDVWELEINLRTAKALGLELPQSLLVRAARLIS